MIELLRHYKNEFQHDSHVSDIRIKDETKYTTQEALQAPYYTVCECVMYTM